MTDINKMINEMAEQEKDPRATAMKEAQSRASLLRVAKRMGCENELRQIMKKYDQKLSSCTNRWERKHIAVAGIMEVNKLLGCPGGVAVNGVTIVPAEPGFTEPIH